MLTKKGRERTFRNITQMDLGGGSWGYTYIQIHRAVHFRIMHFTIHYEHLKEITDKIYC